MGYTTDFDGSFTLDRPLTTEHREYLIAFSNTRHIARNPEKAGLLEDPVRIAAGLPLGPQGAYFVGSDDIHKDSVLDFNLPPKGQPGLWCQWVPDSEGTEIVWDLGEKFYNSIEWIRYILDHFLGPWGYKLNGEVIWRGEDIEDIGKIVVKNNKVSAKRVKFV